MGGIQGVLWSGCCSGCTMCGFLQQFTCSGWLVWELVSGVITFLKWNCFFIAWVSRAVNFWIRWCAGVQDVERNLKLNWHTSIFCVDSWQEERICMTLLIKFVFIILWIWRFVFLKYLVGNNYGSGLLNLDLEFATWCHRRIGSFW